MLTALSGMQYLPVAVPFQARKQARVLFHRATKTVRMEMICPSFKLFSQKAHRGFVPLSYQPENNDIPVHTPPTGFDALRTIAVSRIYLDNFDHITAYWVGNHYLFQRTSALVSPPTSAGCPASRENPNQKIPRGFPRALKPRQR